MVTPKNFAPLMTGLAVAALAAPALAALAAPALAVPDAHFMKAAAQGGMTEVTLGKIAMQNAASPNVKQFGMQMVQDHSQADHELKMIAAKQGVALPKGLGPKNAAVVGKLSSLHGAAFDKAYVKAMIKDHVEDIQDFSEESKQGRNPQVKTFSAKYLPVIQGHLMMVQDLAKKGI